VLARTEWGWWNRVAKTFTPGLIGAGDGEPPTSGLSTRATVVEESFHDPLVEFLEIAVETRVIGQGTPANGNIPASSDYVKASSTRAWKVHGPDANGAYGGLQGIGGLEAVYEEHAVGTVAQAPSWTGVIDDYYGHIVATVAGEVVSETALSYHETKSIGYGPAPDSPVHYLSEGASLTQSTAWRGKRQDITGFYYLGARYYEPSSARFLSTDPMGHGASMSLYDYAGGDPINFVDPTGRYGEAGHFWTTFAIANAAGLNPEEAFSLAYYSQLPDEKRVLDATQVALTYYGENSWIENRLTKVEYTRFSGDGELIELGSWMNKVHDNLHSLHGGDARQVENRQMALAETFATQGIDTMTKGFIIHALADSYAHVDSNGSAYSPGRGHAIDSVKNAVPLSDPDPDLVTANFDNYKAYATRLYGLLNEGKGDPQKLHSFLAFTSNLNTRDGHINNNDNVGAWVRTNTQWSELKFGRDSYNPNAPWSTIESMPDPSFEQVNTILNLIGVGNYNANKLNRTFQIRGGKIEFETPLSDESQYWFNALGKNPCNY
jgi:RHS repeat-associated protein